MNRKLNYFIFLTGLVCMANFTFAQKQNFPSKKVNVNGQEMMIDTRIDNMKYWRSMAEMGVVPVAPDTPVEAAVPTGNKISAMGVVTENSPDVPVTNLTNTTQSENSIFVDPNDPQFLLNSNNSTGIPASNIYGANDFMSTDGGLNWGGELQGAGGGNSGDPATAISLDGRMYVGFIHNNYGQGISYSTNGGNTWTPVLVASPPGGSMLDKNHLWVDISPVSPYKGNLYDAWTPFGGANNEEIELKRSTNGGLTWGSPINVSSAVNAGSHNQGVNINTGPEGEVYVVWAIYDAWPQDEKALGFARSFDGGATFQPATRIINNTRGIRNTETSKNHRVNSFPSMAVDISGGSYNGNIYVVWCNIGVPGINTGSDKDVYLIRSEDQGATWSSPIRVNQDPSGLGKEHYFPWVTCDPETGTLSVVFYDDRNVNSNQCEVWCANSFDGGETWEDFKVSDVAFTPQPISGLAGGYMGDYLGITARGSYVYPCWTDNRSGNAMTYVSPYITNNLPKPFELTADLNETTGQVDLEWAFNEVPGFQYFNVYREDVLLGTTTDTTYTDNLPAYGVFKFKVTAFHTEGESAPAQVSLQWGNPQIAVAPGAITAALNPGESTVKNLTIENVGELELTYSISPQIISKGSKAYCAASGGCDEFIQNVQVGTINNSSSCDGYADYTNLSTVMSIGESYNISVVNGTTQWPSDQCGMWVDWNQDEDFSDPNETLTVGGTPGVGPYTATITPPADAVPGDTRLRIRITYTGSVVECGSTTFGEVEDYTISVLGWLLVDPTSGTIQAGNSDNVSVTLDAADLVEGVYTANLNISSNDPDNAMTVVPVTLTVGEAVLQAEPYANPAQICEGGSSQLFSNATGGTGNYTYSWTSNPPGFTSNQANPNVVPSVTTTYTVVVNDGLNSVSGSVTVTVTPLPGTAATPTGDEDLCINSPNSTYNTVGASNASSYIWELTPAGAGSISGNGITGIVNWNDTFTGQASVKVKGVNTCGDGSFSNALAVEIHPLPTVTLAEYDTICINTPPFELTGGEPAGGIYSGTGVSNGYFYPEAAGIGEHTITYTYEDSWGCGNSALATIYVDQCTGIFDYTEGLRLEIVPNPGNGLFTVKIESEREALLNMRILNMLGVEVYSRNNVYSGNFSRKIDLRGYGDGVYFISIYNNDVNVMKKIVIDR
ncbi:MAG: T9SS type A sorting domain-containing protein [Bacteroidales bacterium]|nr:T9SS type A sorting domain-containing protein [Bacteroidales bacterium]